MRCAFFLPCLFLAQLLAAPPDDCSALRSAFEKWTVAYAKRDLPGTIAIFASDVIFCFQGSPDATKSDLEKSYRSEFAQPDRTQRWIPRFEEFNCSGNLGFVRSTWRLEVTDAAGKVEVKAENRSVDILRLTKEGQWQIFRSLNYPVATPKKG